MSQARQEVPRGGREGRGSGRIRSTRRCGSSPRDVASPSSTRPSRSRCASASTRSTPTRWCAAPSCCRTGSGETARVLVFAQGEKIKEAEDAGADLVGGEELAKKIEGGWLDFDAVVATPDMMRVVGRLGKVLGPRGLMPNPKTGTVTADVAKAITEIKAGKVEFRVDKTGIVHAPFGKRSFGADKLQENAHALVAAIVKAKPAAAKGKYVRTADRLLDHGPRDPRRRGAARRRPRRKENAMATEPRDQERKSSTRLRGGAGLGAARLRHRLQGHHGPAGHRAARNACARSGGQYVVVKNTLARLAVDGKPLEQLKDALHRPDRGRLQRRATRSRSPRC